VTIVTAAAIACVPKNRFMRPSFVDSPDCTVR
jgi:hypothetical protein